jgi:gas vesicle protein
MLELSVRNRGFEAKLGYNSGEQKIPQLTVEQENEMSDNENGVSGLGWFLAGLGLGALVGVLYAPKAGKETREDLVASALEAKDKAAVLAQQGKERAAELAEQGKQQVNEYVDRGKEYYDRGRTQWSQYVEKGKGLVQEQQDKVAAAIDAGKEAYVSATHETHSS